MSVAPAGHLRGPPETYNTFEPLERALEAGPIDNDASILFEASLGLDQLSQYHWRLRNVIKREFGK